MSSNSKEDARQKSGTEAATLRGKKAPTIIVPLDGTVHAMVALPVAQTLAELEGATLHIVHVAEPILPPREIMDKAGLTSEQLRGSVIHQATGTPAESIARIAREKHSLGIVMCAYTGMEKPRGKLGPVAEEVLHLMPCPIVLVRPQRGLQPWILRSILLPHDGTPITAAAIGPAADLAQRSGAELLVLHVAEAGAGRPVESGTFAMPRYVDQPHHEWPAWTREFLDRLRTLGRPAAEVKLHLFLAVGDPGEEIVRFAKEHSSDLVVLAWRGRLELERAATMKKLIQEAPCPLLILRVK